MLSRARMLLISLFLLIPTVASAQTDVSASLGLDIGALGEPGASLDETSGAVAMMHILGVQVQHGRWSFGGRTGFPIPLSFSLQAVLDATYTPRGHRRSGPLAGAALRAMPVIWFTDPARCPAGTELGIDPCRPIDSRWGAAVEPTFGWQFRAGRMLFQPKLSYSAGLFRSHTRPEANVQFAHGAVLSLAVVILPRVVQ